MKFIEKKNTKGLKKRNDYFGFLLLTIFVFCTLGSLFAVTTLSISKKDVQQVSEHYPSDYNGLPLFAELNEEDVTDFDSNFIGLNLQNDYCTFHSNNFISISFISGHCPNDHQNLPIFITNRSIKI